MQDIEQFCINEFSFLENNLLFSKPLVKRKDWITEVYYLGDEIGVELEIDWRELDFFVLIVRLDEGKIPNGYYVSNGKKSRIHIEKILKEYLEINDKELLKSDKKNKIKTKEALTEQIVGYKTVLSTYGSKIIELGNSIFKM